MKRFAEYFLIKEADANTSTEMAFSDAADKVKEIFSYLHKLMRNTWGKQAPTWDAQLKSKVIIDLQNVIDKLKDNLPKTESVENIKHLVKESIILESPDWIKDITSQNKTITVDRMLTTMQDQIIKILHNLRDEILVKKMGELPGEVSRVGSRVSRNIGTKVKGIGSAIQQQIAGGVKVHPEISGQDRQTARYLLIKLSNVLRRRPEIKLYSAATGSRQLKFDPSNEQQMSDMLNKLSKGKSFRIKLNGKDYPFDITDEGDGERIISLILADES